MLRILRHLAAILALPFVMAALVPTLIVVRTKQFKLTMMRMRGMSLDGSRVAHPGERRVGIGVSHKGHI